MNGITHKQAKDYIHAELDGLLTEAQRHDLDGHLSDCEACRIEAESLSMLATRLKISFHDRWDGQYGPSENVQLGVLSQRGRIIMSNRIRFGMRTLAGFGALVVLGCVINFIFSQFRNTSIGPGEIDPSVRSTPAGLIAFVSGSEAGNEEIYTMKADGSGLTNLTNNPATDTSPAWSPDGTRLAFLSDRNGQLDILSMKSDGSDLTQLTNSAENEFGFWWSPNGTQIAYYATSAQDPNLHDIIIMDADGSNKTVLTGEPGLYFFPNWLPDANWSLDGSRLVFLEQAGQSKKEVKTKYYVANSDGTNFQELAELDGTVLNSRWHGNHIIALMQHLTATGERKWELYRLSMDGALPQKLASYDKRIVNWFGDLPDLTYIVETGPVTWSWFKTDGRESTPLNVWKNNFQNCRGFEVEMQVYDALSPSGEKLLVSSFCNEGLNWLYLVNTDGSESKSLISEPISGQVFDQITWSPDDRYLVFGVYPDTSQNFNFDYYILNVADALADPTTRPTRLTTDNTQNKGGAAIQPVSNVISVEITPKPDNNVLHEGLIAFVSGQENGNEEIYTMKADGSGLTNLTNNPATDTSPAWSPDGTHIAFNSDRSGDMDIYVMDADGSNVKRLTDDRGFEGLLSWSPDGQRIVFTSSDNSLNYDGQLIVMNADGGNEIILTPEPGTYYFLGWSPDGQKIIFEYFYENSKDNRIVAASVDGTGAELLGPYFEGDNGRLHRQIHWEAPDQFVTISSNSERPTWGRWNLTRFFTTGNYADYNGSNPIIVTQDYPIVAVFDKTFVVESMDSLGWFPYSGEPFPLSPWNFSERCTEAGEPNLQRTDHTVSPNGKQAFVTVHCSEGVTWFYLENADGSQFVQLTDFSVPDPSRDIESPVIDTSWSPDGKFVTATIASSISRTTDIFLFDIEKMLIDPSTMPIQITTDGAMKYGAVWQSQP